MDKTSFMKGSLEYLSHFAERSLKIIGHMRQVIMISTRRGLRFSHSVKRIVWIGATMIHIVSRKIGATTQLAYNQRFKLPSIDIYPTMIRRHHTTAQLTSKVGIWQFWTERGGIFRQFLLRECLCGNSTTHAFVSHNESIGITARHILQFPVPESVGIVTIKRQQLSENLFSPKRRPTGTCIERDINIFQCLQIIPRTATFVLDLHADHRTAIFPQKSVNLSKNSIIKLRTIFKESGSTGTYLILRILPGFLMYPWRNSALIHFPMTERTKTQHQHHIFFCTDPDEAAQIMIAAPVPFSLLRFMVNPEDICRNDIDTTGLHFVDFPAPFRLRYAGIVNLAHDGNDMLAVKDKPLAIHQKSFAFGCCRCPKPESTLCWNHWQRQYKHQ